MSYSFWDQPKVARQQAKALSNFYDQSPRLQAQNRKLKKLIALLLVVGTIQWVLFLIA